MQSRHDLFTVHCNNITDQRLYFDPFINRINEEYKTFEETDFNNIDLDDSKHSKEYI